MSALPRVRPVVLRSLLAALLGASLSCAAPVATSTAADRTGHGRSVRNAHKVVIHAIGDSITYGASTPASTPGGYRVTLDRRLSRVGIDADFVGTSTENAPRGANPADFAHDGWNGERIDELTASLNTPTDLGGGNWLVRTPQRSALDSDVTVIMAGVNDVYQHYDPQHPDAALAAQYDPAAFTVFVDDLADRLYRLARSVHHLDPGTSLVLCTNVPVDYLFSDGNHPADVRAAQALNVAIRGRVLNRLRRDGVPVELADVDKAFRAERGVDLIADGVHPSTAGYAVLGQTVARAVTAVVAARQDPVSRTTGGRGRR